MFVAMPTAIPEEPLTSRFGSAEGRTVGSRSRSSKFGAWSTVFLSMSPRSWLAKPASRALGVAVGGRGVAVDRPPKLPWPSTSGYRSENPCAIRTSESYTAPSPWGWYLPITSPTTVALFRYGRGGSEPGLVHREQDPPVHGLEAVADIRQSALHDYAHRIVD